MTKQNRTVIFLIIHLRARIKSLILNDAKEKNDRVGYIVQVIGSVSAL